MSPTQNNNEKQEETYIDSIERLIIEVLPVLYRQIETSRNETYLGINTLSEGFASLTGNLFNLIAKLDSKSGDPNELKALTQVGTEIQDDVNNLLVSLQFQDRVSQILSHVISGSDQVVDIVGKTRSQRVSDEKIDEINVENLLQRIRETYSTTEERLNHKDDKAHDLSDSEASELTFF